MRLEMDGPLPGGLPSPQRNDPCGCGSGKKFKKCCWARTIPPSAHPPRLLVVGAGASIEECKRSGANPGDPLPTIANFGRKVFNESHDLQRITASYLETHGIVYDSQILEAYASTVAVGSIPISEDAFRNSPLRVFLRLEEASPSEHNVERLFQHVWQTFGDSGDLWEVLAWDGVYLYLFNAFITQFGLGPAKSIRQLQAGIAIAKGLYAADSVINLNYDLAFDLALQQARKYFCYAPEVRRDAINVYKPHGSFNLYCHRMSGDCFFADPSQPRGSVAIRDARGGVWSPAAAIVPPRLEKRYAQHPSAEMILAGLHDFRPEVVTFWGVGLTDSDADLLEIYQRATKMARVVEFINPNRIAWERAKQLLGRQVQHHSNLDAWLAEHGLL
jgi:hypothetical protein